MTDDKTAIRLVCPKFNGHKGKEFTAWKRQYLDGCHLKGDDDASYTDCYLGNDPQAGLSAAQGLSSYPQPPTPLSSTEV